MPEVDIQDKRPLSPHLTVYRPIPTMVVSILHRVMGAALYFGTIIFVWWLVAAASGEEYFDAANSILATWPAQLILFGFTWALFQHMLGGIKHLFWDVGYGFDKQLSAKIAWATLIGSVLLTCLVWLVGYAVR